MSEKIQFNNIVKENFLINNSNNHVYCKLNKLSIIKKC